MQVYTCPEAYRIGNAVCMYSYAMCVTVHHGNGNVYSGFQQPVRRHAEDRIAVYTYAWSDGANKIKETINQILKKERISESNE